MLSTNLKAGMHSICNYLMTPVIVLVLVFCVVTVVIFGTLIAEILFERRYLKEKMSKLIDEFRKGEIPPEESISKSKLLKRQKVALIELTKHKELTASMREALAIHLIQEEKSRYDSVIKISDLIVKIGPAAGLLGTLIPLGPGIIAMGQGDTYTLSQSLMVAFDTTVLGLSCGCLNTVISTIRKKWYTNDISVLETLMECLLEIENLDLNKTGKTKKDEDFPTISKDIIIEA